MKPFFRHKQIEALPPPDGHRRVAAIADRFNDAITGYEEVRQRVLAEIAEKQEELRQLDVVITACRAALVTIVDDPTLTFGTANVARAHIDPPTLEDAITAEFAA